MTPAELQDLMLATSRALQELIDRHDEFVERDAEAQRVARVAEARGYLEAYGKTVAEREALRDIECADVRYAADMARGLRESSKLAIQAKQAQLSALQSAVSAMREEMRLSGVGGGA